MQDHYLVPHFDFYVLDMAKEINSHLNLPLDKGTARNCILVENGLVYITVNPNSEGSYVWIYDPKTGLLRKGLHFDDRVTGSTTSSGWNGGICDRKKISRLNPFPYPSLAGIRLKIRTPETTLRNL
ncbi:hypothetical protein [Larkinella rosea]|uniref:Uncharacterized protein n=1 Tax=Larkinella rosea TaxID=2025312 RepID=A0A3P1BPU0_9BACT|nr:hypothetical protein [Larkinella rosea]RRB02574.1 hypothetical protein EHT25_19175 [Larkinella rosea]